MRVQKNPTAGTIAMIWKDGIALPQGVAVDEMTEEQFEAWKATQPPPPEPPDPVPTNLPAWRIRAVLRKRGLLTSVTALLAQLPADVRAVAEEQLNDSKFERDHPLIGQLGAALNLTDKDLDDIFREADALV